MASHFTFEERQVLYRLSKAKTPKARIAEILTNYRELKRNTGGCGYRLRPVVVQYIYRWRYQY